MSWDDDEEDDDVDNYQVKFKGANKDHKKNVQMIKEMEKTGKTSMEV